MFVVKQSGIVIGLARDAELDDTCAFLRRTEAIDYMAIRACEDVRQICDLCTPEQTTIIDLCAGSPVITVTVTTDARLVLLANGGYVGDWTLSEHGPYDLEPGLRALQQFISHALYHANPATFSIYDPINVIVRTVNVFDGGVVRYVWGVYNETQFEDLPSFV